MSLRIGVYGDSLSSGTHGDGAYHQALRDWGADLSVHAVGGSPLADVAPSSLVAVLSDPANVHDDLDAAIVWHGSNDWYWGSQLGDADAGPRTYVGAWHHCVGILRAARPGLPVIAPTPLWRDEAPDGGGTERREAYRTPNRLGLTLADYRSALEDVARELDLHLVDMDAAGLGRHNADEVYEDRVHPNARGYALISPVLLRGLEDALGRG